MESTIDRAIQKLTKKLKNGFKDTVKIHILGEGSIIIDHLGVRRSDEAAECTVTATEKTFKSILDGKTKVQVAILSKKLTINGNIAPIMKLGSFLS
jgi:putative sterol carrier protein|tara:strand:+ start:606 stop:893 length:288 start_codon:yes stop_codon:yes gene_type:complete